MATQTKPVHAKSTNGKGTNGRGTLSKVTPTKTEPVLREVKHPDLKDPYFGPAYLDIDEWRDTPVRHRYVHGGFKNTETRFSFYFPPPELFKGRILHHLEGGSGGHDNAAVGDVPFAFSLGAVLTESNRGHFGGDLTITRTEPLVHIYRAPAESTRLARILATEMYGKRPKYGYVWGGSGGSGPTMVCLEKASDIFDGCVPYVIGHGNSWSYGFSVQANVTRILGDKIYKLVDAMAPGGSGKVFDGLNSEEREAMATLYRSGQPRGAELVLLTSGYMGTWANHISALCEFDPTYLSDFWNKPGYEGGDGRLDKVLIDKKTTVTKVVHAKQLREGEMAEPWRMRYLLSRSADDAALGVVIKGIDPKKALGLTIKVLSGKVKGHELHTTVVLGDVLIAQADVPYRFEGVEPGDEVQVDNRKYLAYCYFHRYQTDDSPQYGQLRVDGEPIYPKRKTFAGLSFDPPEGWRPSGKFTGKQIVVQNAHDAACLPNAGHAWRKQLEGTLGARLNDQFRLWYTEKAAHGPPSSHPPTDPMPGARLIEYRGVLEQAIRDVVTWVEEGKAPSPTTGYQFDADQQLLLAPTADKRGGTQPVVKAKANGGVRAEVKVGQPVTLEAVAETPPGTGTIINVEWDFDGKAEWKERDASVTGKASKVTVKTTHKYTKAGTYFPAVRVTSNREGDVNAKFGRAMNLDRVRVVVK